MNSFFKRFSLGAWLIFISLVIGIPAAIVAAVALYIASAAPLQAAAPPVLITVVLIASGIIALLAGLLFVVGLAIYVVLPSLSPERARRDFGSHRTVLACIALAIVISSVIQVTYLFGEVLTGGLEAMRLGGGQVTPTMLIVAIVSLEVSLLFILWLRIIRPKAITWQEMGLTTEWLSRKALIGVATGIAIFVAAGAIEFILGRFGIQQTQAQQFEPVKNATLLQFIVLLLAGAVLTPFAEEAFFRGYIFDAYWKQKGLVQAYVFSSLIFAVVHLNLPAFLPILVTGLILAHVFRLTGSIIPTMIAHALNNGIAFTVLYLGLS